MSLIVKGLKTGTGAFMLGMQLSTVLIGAAFIFGGVAALPPALILSAGIMSCATLLSVGLCIGIPCFPPADRKTRDVETATTARRSVRGRSHHRQSSRVSRARDQGSRPAIVPCTRRRRSTDGRLYEVLAPSAPPHELLQPSQRLTHSQAPESLAPSAPPRDWFQPERMHEPLPLAPPEVTMGEYYQQAQGSYYSERGPSFLFYAPNPYTQEADYVYNDKDVQLLNTYRQ